MVALPGSFPILAVQLHHNNLSLVTEKSGGFLRHSLSKGKLGRQIDLGGAIPHGEEKGGDGSKNRKKSDDGDGLFFIVANPEPGSVVTLGAEEGGN